MARRKFRVSALHPLMEFIKSKPEVHIPHRCTSLRSTASDRVALLHAWSIIEAIGIAHLGTSGVLDLATDLRNTSTKLRD